MTSWAICIALHQSHSAYLTICRVYKNAMLDESELESRLPGEISTISDMQMISL